MEDIKQIIAKNIASLRTDSKLTQLELAEKLNYSDKAISKWERGESIPDVITLKSVADLFGVTVDYLITEHEEGEKPQVSHTSRNNHIIITLISVVSVWLLGTCAFAFSWIFDQHLWMAFIVCIPISMIVLLVFNSIWGRPQMNMYIISVLMWSIFLSFYLGFYAYLGYNLWLLFIIGIPAQIVIFLCFRIHRHGDSALKAEKKAAKEERKAAKKAAKAAKKVAKAVAKLSETENGGE